MMMKILIPSKLCQTIVLDKNIKKVEISHWWLLFPFLCCCSLFHMAKVLTLLVPKKVYKYYKSFSFAIHTKSYFQEISWLAISSWEVMNTKHDVPPFRGLYTLKSISPSQRNRFLMLEFGASGSGWKKLYLRKKKDSSQSVETPRGFWWSLRLDLVISEDSRYTNQHMTPHLDGETVLNFHDKIHTVLEIINKSFLSGISQLGGRFVEAEDAEWLITYVGYCPPAEATALCA